MDQQTTEQQLRIALRDEQQPMPVWHDPVSRVEEGITRRRRRRWIVGAVVSTLLAGSAAVGVMGRQAGIPTVDTAVSATESVDAPPIQRRSPRPERQPCQLDEAESLEWIVQSAPWGPATGFGLRPFGNERCTLAGRPALYAINVATGAGELVATVDLGPLDGNITRQFPATIDPGEPARIHIRGNTTCREGEVPQSYRDLTLVAGDKHLRVPDFRNLTNICGADVSPWFVEPPMEYAALNVSVDAPPILRRGQDFTYVVRIDNVFPRSFPMSTCPVYRLTLASADEGWQRIICTPTVIRAHSTIRFTLRGHVPAETALGKQKLTWMAVMGNGEAAIADMGTSGLAVSITE